MSKGPNWEWEYKNLCKFANDYEKERDQLRLRVNKDEELIIMLQNGLAQAQARIQELEDNGMDMLVSLLVTPLPAFAGKTALQYLGGPHETHYVQATLRRMYGNARLELEEAQARISEQDARIEKLEKVAEAARRLLAALEAEKGPKP